MRHGTLAIDFDGVVRRKDGEPMINALDSLWELREYYIIIHTSMANTTKGRKLVANWLEKHDVKYDEIQGKPMADYYIDDKAIRHVSWGMTLSVIMEE